MTPTHELPADAFRRDRTPAPPTDHQTIEQRLSRLEADVRAITQCLHAVTVALESMRNGASDDR